MVLNATFNCQLNSYIGGGLMILIISHVKHCNVLDIIGKLRRVSTSAVNRYILYTAELCQEDKKILITLVSIIQNIPQYPYNISADLKLPSSRFQICIKVTRGWGHGV